MVFGKSTLSGMTEAEVSLWRSVLEEKIENHMGKVAEDLSEQTFVVFPTCKKGSEQLVTQIKAFIQCHRITEEKFNQLKLIDERQLCNSLDNQDQEYADQHRVLKDVFRMFI